MQSVPLERSPISVNWNFIFPTTLIKQWVKVATGTSEDIYLTYQTWINTLWDFKKNKIKQKQKQTSKAAFMESSVL